MKLVSSMRNKLMHNARNMSNIKTLEEHLLKVKGVKMQMQNDTRLSDDDNKDEGLYNELKAWKTASAHKHEQGTCKCSYSFNNNTRPVSSCESN